MKCKGCGKEFLPLSAQQRYCSQDCCYQTRLRTSREKSQIFTRTCPVCLEKFKTTNPKKRFCCVECADEYAEIAEHVMAKNRLKIQALLERVRSEPNTSIKEIMKGYPTR